MPKHTSTQAVVTYTLGITKSNREKRQGQNGTNPYIVRGLSHFVLVFFCKLQTPSLFSSRSLQTKPSEPFLASAAFRFF